MTIERKRVLAVAVASRKIAFVFLIDGRLKDWKHSRAGGTSPTKGRSFLRMAIGRYEPDRHHLIEVDERFEVHQLRKCVDRDVGEHGVLDDVGQRLEIP